MGKVYILILIGCVALGIGSIPFIPAIWVSGFAFGGAFTTFVNEKSKKKKN